MSDINITFCQSLLKEAHKLVKLHFPKTDLRKDAWVYHFHGDNWEFHGPDNFYWYGSADNAYDAKYHGWMAWLKTKGIK